MTIQLLRPAIVLVLWSLFMLAWLVEARLPAMRRAGIDLMRLRGGKGGDADGALDPRAQWKAHNYNHLMEQPTLFYATVGLLALSGRADLTGVVLAWAYVALRIAHSLWQALVNRVSIRFALFSAGTFTLVLLAGWTALRLFSAR